MRPNNSGTGRGYSRYDECSLEQGEARQLAFGSAVLMGRLGGQLSDAEQDRIVAEGLKEVTMHENRPYARTAS